MNKSKDLKPKGHVEIWKVYEDNHTKELVWEEDNVITSGMGVALSHLFSASGSTSILGYQILNFACGSGGDITNYGASSFKLNDQFHQDDYGDNASLVIEEFAAIENGSLGLPKHFPRIKFSNIHKVSPTSARFTLVLDSNTLNVDEDIDEIGLFMRNPRGLNPSSPILVAYRPFPGIRKTSSFSLIFVWTIQF
jgi:hypothetical protein